MLIGFPLEWVILQQTLNLYYQLFAHTEAVTSMGPLEKFFNTPSHHRVHHAKNMQYLDKNYAGTFIIWDRLHGTYEGESVPCIYGAYGAPKSHNPFTIAFHMWQKLVRDLWFAECFGKG